MRRTIHTLLRCNLWLAAALAATVGVSGTAQAREDEQAWQTLTINLGLPDNFRLSNETVVRSGNDRGLYEVENTLSIGRKLGKRYTAWLGYTHDPQYVRGDFTVMEHRFRQQLNLDDIARIGAAKVTGRVRMEERWREGIDGTGWRLRPALKVALPLTGKTTVAVQSEQFFNLNTTPFQRVSGHDRMRNSLSVAIPLAKKFGIDVGYLNQTTFVRNGENTSDHVFTLGLSANF